MNDFTSRPGRPAEPRAAAGLLLLTFSISPLIEGAYWGSWAEMGIAVALAAAGWWLLRPAADAGNSVATAVASAVPRSPRQRWIRFGRIAVPVFTLVYVAGYLACMDRHTPTDPKTEFGRFPSSFRWAPRTSVRKGTIAHATPWRVMTVWNVVYHPMDLVWFHFFPRTRDEEQRLRAVGYYR